jgi:hypothetical protein
MKQKYYPLSTRQRLIDPEETIDDGFENIYSRYTFEMVLGEGLLVNEWQIVRPGKVHYEVIGFIPDWDDFYIKKEEEYYQNL